MAILLWTLLALVSTCCLAIAVACGGLIWRAASAMFDAAPSAPLEHTL